MEGQERRRIRRRSWRIRQMRMRRIKLDLSSTRRQQMSSRVCRGHVHSVLIMCSTCPHHVPNASSNCVGTLETPSTCHGVRWALVGCGVLWFYTWKHSPNLFGKETKPLHRQSALLCCALSDHPSIIRLRSAREPK